MNNQTASAQEAKLVRIAVIGIPIAVAIVLTVQYFIDHPLHLHF